MKNILSLFVLTMIVVSCGSKSSGNIDDLIASDDLKAIRAKKAEMVTQQNEIKAQIEELDDAIARLDENSKIPLITTIELNEQNFIHYLELQGSVTTKNLLVIYPQFSGILTNVYVKEGQRVQKGQVLAKIDDGGLSQQLAQLKIQADLSGRSETVVQLAGAIQFGDYRDSQSQKKRIPAGACQEDRAIGE